MWPNPAHSLMHAVAEYFRRLARWLVIVLQVRGQTFRDECILLSSALASPITAFRQFGAWQDPILLFDANVKVRRVGMFRVRRRTDDLWHVTPWRETRVEREIRSRLLNGDWFIDAGANIGYYSIMAARLVGSNGKVLAFEMLPNTAAILRHHVAINQASCVSVHEGALTDKLGEALTATMPDCQYGQATIVRRQGESHTVCNLEVKAITLDTEVQVGRRIRLLKMDLEGAEAMALRGSIKTLEWVDAVLFEQLPGGQDVRSVLFERGYECRQLDGGNWIGFRPSHD